LVKRYGDKIPSGEKRGDRQVSRDIELIGRGYGTIVAGVFRPEGIGVGSYDGVRGVIVEGRFIMLYHRDVQRGISRWSGDTDLVFVDVDVVRDGGSDIDGSVGELRGGGRGDIRDEGRLGILWWW